MEPVKTIIIVGGGTAGWITAGLVAKKHRTGKNSAGDPSGIRLILVESPDIDTVGVGEGTWPSMRNTLKKIGISENELIRHCHASFKQGSKFVNWTDGDEAYYHPFMPPQGYPDFDLAPYWATQQSTKQATQQNRHNSFATSVGFQQQICEAGLAPKDMTIAEYQGITNYGYHLDAGQFAQLLKEFCINNLGVEHVVDTVTNVQQDAAGYITAVETRHRGLLAGDLFVDCSGFRSLLLGDTLKVPFIPKDDVLFADTALALQLPYADPQAPIASQTISTAQEAGWIWDIGLSSRRGIGYVYSSAFTTDERAEAVLRDYVGTEGDELAVRKISFQTGYREKFWEKNCVAIGLSAGFIEPLEASALMQIESAAQMLSEQLPGCREVMPQLACRFNEVFRYRWERVIDFLKLHYVLSRRHGDFWQANRDPGSIPDSLNDLLQLWQYQPPSAFDFHHSSEVFPWPSYQYVLYGMGFDTNFGLNLSRHHQGELAQLHFALCQRSAERALAHLPSHRDLLNKAIKHGFQPL